MEYLETMGIDMYVPKWLLANAAVPQQAILPVVKVPTFATDPKEFSPDNSSIGNTVAEPVKDCLGSTEGPDKTADIVHKIPKQTVVSPEKNLANISSETNKSTKNIPAFALSIWSITGKFLIVDSRQSSLALPTDALLSNILQSLGLPAGDLPKSQVIRWPLVPNNSQYQSREDAQEMVRSFLTAQLASVSAHSLLLMGNEAQDYALAEELESLVEQTHIDRSNSFAVKVVLLPSLADLLRQPLQKRLAWQALMDAQLLT